MGQVSAKLRRMAWGYAFYCPACNDLHVIATERPNHPNWKFNGNLEKPTFQPSVRQWGMHEHKPYCCHYNLTDGMLAYSEDCTHALRWQTVALPDLPEYFQDSALPDLVPPTSTNV